jgi:hypothetical protein
MKQQITMNKSQNLSIEEAYQLFIRKAHIRNLSEQTIKTYNNHFGFFSQSTDIDTTAWSANISPHLKLN